MSLLGVHSVTHSVTQCVKHPIEDVPAGIVAGYPLRIYILYGHRSSFLPTMLRYCCWRRIDKERRDESTLGRICALSISPFTSLPSTVCARPQRMTVFADSCRFALPPGLNLFHCTYPLSCLFFFFRFCDPVSRAKTYRCDIRVSEPPPIDRDIFFFFYFFNDETRDCPRPYFIRFVFFFSIGKEIGLSRFPLLSR